jgi:hypothetical protein
VFVFADSRERRVTRRAVGRAAMRVRVVVVVGGRGEGGNIHPG